ncbi:hypothetical protein Ahy_A07g034629 [Arachis hypogaea]|uniref:FAR1 domain-containing protein n=1 Tax=Arachis hypogaea TaxID=3818 RepID=A0A445CCL4_ARAHY|nr:hypothetical protein Ahy_A07g034629 [Arachis hypogaea]
MNSETILMEKTEAVDLSEADADIEVEESMMIVDGIGSFDAIEFSALTAKDILMTEFINLQAAYDYYNEYGRIKGFSVRRSKIFVCLRKREQEGKHMQQGDRKMDTQPITRCGCEARIKVHVDDTSGQWYVEQFCDSHVRCEV